MFFTKTANVIAWLMFGFSSFYLVLATAAAFMIKTMEQNREFARAYLAANTTGEASDKAAMYIGIAIVLGVLSEISRNLNKR